MPAMLPLLPPHQSLTRSIRGAKAGIKEARDRVLLTDRELAIQYHTLDAIDQTMHNIGLLAGGAIALLSRDDYPPEARQSALEMIKRIAAIVEEESQ